MPKYGIHHIVITDAIGKLMASEDEHRVGIGKEMAGHMGYANLGAIGPDLFFWAPDYEIVHKLYPFYKSYKKLVDLYNTVVQPIRDVMGLLEEGAEEVAPATYGIIEATLNEIRETADLFSTVASQGLFAGVIEGANLVTDAAGFPSLAAAFFDDMFKPGVQKGEAISDWYWFDMLHYRRTGQFGRALVEYAERPEERAYAYGYLSHIATDVVGHAYVNQVVGGPYRMHMQRHVTVENYMDVWKYQEYYNENISATLASKLKLPKSLPGRLASMIEKALKQVYLTEHPNRLDGGGFLNDDQIQQTYEVFYDVLQIMSSQGIARPEEPFSNVGEILKAALDDLLEAPPSPPSSSSSTCSFEDIFSFGLTSSSRDCYDNFFDEMGDWLEYIGDLLVWTFETLLDLLDLLGALLLSLPATVIMAILYGIQLLLYEVYQAIRSTLALEGFIYPDPSDLNSSHGRNLVTPFQCSIQGCGTGTIPETMTHVPEAFYQPGFPRLANLSVSHLVCPRSDLEQPPTIPNPLNPTGGTTPNSFIHEEPFSVGALHSYALASNVEATRSLYAKCQRIGNATDFTAWMIGMAGDEGASERQKIVCFTDWNLDADRGYGYKTWDWMIDGTGENPVPEDDFRD